MMSLIGNVLWIVLGGGIFIAIWYLIGGLLLCLTVIGIPFGIQCMKLSLLALMPFGQDFHETRFSTSPVGILMNVLWIAVGGIELVITHIVFAALCAVTIIGFPFAKQHMKLAGLALTPFGKNLT